MKHSSSHFHQCSIFAFNYPILLRSSRRRKSMRNSIFIAKDFENFSKRVKICISSIKSDHGTEFENEFFKPFAMKMEFHILFLLLELPNKIG